MSSRDEADREETIELISFPRSSLSSLQSLTSRNHSLQYDTSEVVQIDQPDTILINSTDSITNEQLFRQLLLYTLANHLNEVIAIVEVLNTELLTYRYEDYDNNTIIVIACTNDQITAATLDTLLVSISKFTVVLKCTDEDWYGWDPIHYASSVGNPEKLRSVIKHMDESINALTYFSENALHILLNYELEAILFDGSDVRRCTLIGEESDNIVECVEILISSNIDVNHNNFWNDSPIGLAIRYRFLRVVAILLEKSYVDIDNSQEGGKSVREILRINNICIQQLSFQDYYLDDPGKIMFNYLKSGDETNFIHLNNGNIKDYVDILDGTCCECSSGTMLHFCFKKGFLQYLQNEAYGEKILDINIMDTPMLSIFCSKGFKRCIEHLLDNGADTHKTTQRVKGSVLEMAAVRGYYPLVAILLQHGNSNVTTEEIFELLPKLYNNKFEDIFKNYSIYRHHVLNLLLNKLTEKYYHTFLSDEYQKCLNNILVKLNLENDDLLIDDSGLICQILGLGSSLLAKDTTVNDNKSKFDFWNTVCGWIGLKTDCCVSVLPINDSCNKTVLERLHTDTLYSHLDDSGDNSCFYYNSLVQDYDTVYSETNILKILNKSNSKREVFTHPVMEQFVNSKWMKIYWFFILLISFYGASLLIICVYMLAVYEGYDNVKIEICFIFVVILQGIKEFIQLFWLYKLSYFKDSFFCPKLIVIIVCVIFYFHHNVYCIVLAILTSAGIFVTLLGQLPKLTKYVLILSSIKYFLQYTLFYCLVLVSFAVSFYVIFPYQNHKDFVTNNSTDFLLENDLFKNVFETLIFFTGEFNERVLSSTRYPIFGRVTFTLFIFCMTIILNNLLVGLIVTDMDKIRKQFKLYKIKKMVEFIISINTLFDGIQKHKKSAFHQYNLFKKGEQKQLTPKSERLATFKKSKNGRCKCSAYDKDVLKKLYDKIKIFDGT